MVVALAPWSLVVAPGKPVSHEVIRDIQITNAALGSILEDQKARSTLKISYRPPPFSDSEDEDEDDKKTSSKKAKTVEIALCSLTPGSIEQAPLNVLFTEDDVVEFEVVGKNSIHLFGNYIDQNPMDLPPDDYDEEDESQDGYNLLDVSSDVEVDPMEYGDISEAEDRFEEIDDDAEEKGKASAGKKHSRDSDGVGDVSMTSASDKKAKKLKNESGAAVPVGDAKPESKPESKKEKKKKAKEKKESPEKKDDTQSATEKEKNGSTPAGTEKAQKSALKELPGGLKTQDFKVGTGKQAKAGNLVAMRYIGKLPNGKIFDSNTKGKPFSFRLGKGEVIKGWDQGIAGMQVGGERLLIVPPSLAYGNKALDGIPANSTLHFECKLLEIK